ncbi:MAG: hypothetical protein WAM28_00065 [Chlamydiales bacterium]
MINIEIYPYVLNAAWTFPVADAERAASVGFEINPEASVGAVLPLLQYSPFVMDLLLKLELFKLEILQRFGEEIRAQGRRATKDHKSRIKRKRQEEGMRLEAEKRMQLQKFQAGFAQRQAARFRAWEGSRHENRHLSLSV